MLTKLFRLLGDVVCPDNGHSNLPEWPYDHIDPEDIQRIIHHKTNL